MLTTCLFLLVTSSGLRCSSLQVSPQMAITSDAPFNLPRAKRLYLEAHKRMSGLADGPLAMPFVHIHVSEKLPCEEASVYSRQGKRIMGCLFREKSHVRIHVQKDDPSVYLGLLIAQLDYEGRCYLPQGAQKRLAEMILSTVPAKELVDSPTKSVGELRP